MGKRNDITGHRFGLLVAVQDVGKNKWGKREWLCRCDCGQQTIRDSALLIRGHTRSCGCAHGKLIGLAQTTHGMTKTPMHRRWQNMIQRCTNQKVKEFKFYGAKGISVCERWLVFENFYQDMGEAPLDSDGNQMQIDRIDETGNYEPSNCQWLPKRDNARKAAVTRWKKEKQNG